MRRSDCAISLIVAPSLCRIVAPFKKMRLLKIIILAVFIVFSAACFYLSAKKNSLPNIIGQILLLDLVFSVDSIITAIGLVNQIWVMYTAVIVTVLIMLVAAAPISNFVNKHPAFKILALSFLLLIGLTLLIEGFGVHVPKGYVYFAMAFAFLVDVIQMKVAGKNTKPIKLKEAFNESADK